jgi:hypothetical protein
MRDKEFKINEKDKRQEHKMDEEDERQGTTEAQDG